jgi:hypothetical protein
MAQLVVAQQTQSILGNPNVQLALLGGGGLLAYWWWQNNINDPEMCVPGLGGGIGGDIVKQVCKAPKKLGEAGADAMDYVSQLPDRLKVATSGNVYEQSELAAEYQQSDNIFEEVGFGAADLLTGGELTRQAEAFKTLEVSIDATQPDPQLTKLMMGRHFIWFDKLKDNTWVNTEALSRTNWQTNLDMAVDTIIRQVETDTNGEMKLAETQSSYAQAGGRTLILTAYSEEQKDWVRVGTPWAITTGWYGLVKMYWESQNRGRYFQDISREEQRRYILSTYGKGEQPLVVWGSGESVPQFFQYYQIKYDMVAQHLVEDNITIGDTIPPELFG